jgi:hypothetical protein
VPIHEDANGFEALVSEPKPKDKTATERQRRRRAKIRETGTSPHTQGGKGGAVPKMMLEWAFGRYGFSYQFQR